MSRYSMTDLPYWIDVGGEWLRTELTVSISPSVVFFQSGVLTSAHTFTDISSIRRVIREQATLGEAVS